MERIGSRAALGVAVVALVIAASGVAVAAPHFSGKAHSASQRGPRGPRGYRGHRGFRGPSGLDGINGATGPAGPAGSAAASPSITTVVSTKLSVPPGKSTYDVQQTGWQAACPGGQKAIATGFNASIGKVAFVLNYGTFVGGFIDNDSSITIQVYLQATCATNIGGGFGAAAAPAPTPSQYQADLQRAEAQAH